MAWFNETQAVNQTMASASTSVAPAKAPPRPAAAAAAAAPETNGVAAPAPRHPMAKFGNKIILAPAAVDLPAPPPPPPVIVEPEPAKQPPPSTAPKQKPPSTRTRKAAATPRAAVAPAPTAAPEVAMPPPPARRVVVPLPPPPPSPPPAPAPVVAEAAAAEEFETVLSDLQQVHDAQLEHRLALNGKTFVTMLRAKVESLLKDDYIQQEMLLTAADAPAAAAPFDAAAHAKLYYDRKRKLLSHAAPTPQLTAVLGDLLAHDVGEFVSLAATPARHRQQGNVRLADYYLAHHQLLREEEDDSAMEMTPAQQLQCQALDELEAAYVKAGRSATAAAAESTTKTSKPKPTKAEAAAQKQQTKRKRDAVLAEVANVHTGSFIHDAAAKDMQLLETWAQSTGSELVDGAHLAEATFNIKLTNDIRYRALYLRSMKGSNRAVEKKKRVNKSRAKKAAAVAK